MIDAAVLAIMRSAATMPAADFVGGVMFTCEPWVFRADPEEHERFRLEIAKKLAVSVEAVVLIGSARLGFSLNADHLLAPFSAGSDLDVVVASNDKFDSASLDLLRRASDFALLGSEEKRLLKKAKEDVASGYLRPDRVPTSSALATDWFPRLAGPFGTEAARSRPVRAWLFKSMEHAQLCYSGHVSRLRTVVLNLLQTRGDL